MSNLPILRHEYFMVYANLAANDTIYLFEALSRFVSDRQSQYVDMAKIAVYKLFILDMYQTMIPALIQQLLRL